MNDCLCGTCPACRREMRELNRNVVKAPVSLSPAAARIMAEPAYTIPVATPREKVAREKKKAASTRKVWSGRNNETRQERRMRRKAERVLVDGKMVHPDANHGTLTGYSDYLCRCAPCSEYNASVVRKRYSERNAMSPDRRRAEGGALTRLELKARQREMRELVDGVMVHPHCEHGRVQSYDYYGCRCEPCREAHSENVRKYAKIRREKLARDMAR